MSTTSKNISIIAILTISLITGVTAATNTNDVFALTHSQIVHKINVLKHKLHALQHHQHHHSHHSALAAQIKSLQNQIKNLENAQTTTTTHHHHHSHVHFVVVNNPHHHNHHFASGSGTSGRDSQSISQDNANEQHSTVLSAGANSPITNSGSNTSTQSNNNAGGNAHA